MCAARSPVQHWLAWIRLLGARFSVHALQEMHQPLPGRTATQHRKTAVSFRDLCLLDIFVQSLEALKRLQNSSDTAIQKQVRGVAACCRPMARGGCHVQAALPVLCFLRGDACVGSRALGTDGHGA